MTTTRRNNCSGEAHNAKRVVFSEVEENLRFVCVDKYKREYRGRDIHGDGFWLEYWACEGGRFRDADEA